MPGFKHFNKQLHQHTYKVDHPDFETLQEVKKRIWANKYLGADNQDEMKQAVGKFVDFDSVTAFSAEMVDGMTETLGLGTPPSDIKAMLVTLVATGFISGALFEQMKETY